jgi:hypothetical protein
MTHEDHDASREDKNRNCCPPKKHLPFLVRNRHWPATFKALGECERADAVRPHLCGASSDWLVQSAAPSGVYTPTLTAEVWFTSRTISAKALRYDIAGNLVKQQWRPAMKTLITTLTLASLVAFSAIAQTARVPARDTTNIYQSYSQGNQTFPNPDRDFDGQNARHPAQTW